MTASQGHPTREGSVLASPARATLAMMPVHAAMGQRLAGRGRGLAMPGRVVVTNGIGGDNSQAWPTPQLPSLTLAKAGSCHPLSSTPCRGPVLTALVGPRGKPGPEDVDTLSREPVLGSVSWPSSPPPLCSGGSRADSCRPGSPFRLGLVWSRGGGARGRSEGEGNSQGILPPCVPSTLPLPQVGPPGSGFCLRGPGLWTLPIPPPPFGPAARGEGASCWGQLPCHTLVGLSVPSMPVTFISSG